MLVVDAEKLKREWTDKYVVVEEGVPELVRFEGRTGQVKTVNMNGRALVQFDAPADISWYDIAPDYLRVTNRPTPTKGDGNAASTAKVADASAAKSSPKIKTASAATSTAASASSTTASSAGLSPLERARQQGAAKIDKAPSSTTTATAAKLSPLELARQQGAAKSDDDEGPSTAAGTSSSAESSSTPPVQAEGLSGESSTADARSSSSPVASSSSAGLSPLELARQQGAFKSTSDGGPPPSSAQASETNTEDDADTDVESSSTPPSGMLAGKPVKADDLTIVEGIGPKIAGLLQEAGIDTWAKLAETEVPKIQGILEAAGPRYRMHKPDTWPEQAGLAAAGRWDELAQRQDELTAGR